MDNVQIITNGHTRDIDSDIKADWHDENEISESFLYKGERYFLDEFITTPPSESKISQWDGMLNQTYFSGIVVKYPRDPFISDGIIVGMFAVY